MKALYAYLFLSFVLLNQSPAASRCAKALEDLSESTGGKIAEYQIAEAVQAALAPRVPRGQRLEVAGYLVQYANQDLVRNGQWAQTMLGSLLSKFREPEDIAKVSNDITKLIAATQRAVQDKADDERRAERQEAIDRQVVEDQRQDAAQRRLDYRNYIAEIGARMQRAGHWQGIVTPREHHDYLQYVGPSGIFRD